MVARQLYNGLVSQSSTCLISYAVARVSCCWLWSRRFRFFRQGCLGGAGTVPWQDGVLISDVCGFIRIWTSKTGLSYSQNRLLSWAADCWRQEAGCSPAACFCFGKREELGWSRAAAEPEAGFPFCSTCCSSCPLLPVAAVTETSVSWDSSSPTLHFIISPSFSMS